MNKYVLFLFVGIFVNALETRGQGTHGTYFEHYCWRDFEGIIPADALPGGRDRNAEYIYIGQTLYDGKLIPGKIYQHDPKIVFEYGDSERSTTQNVKILCTPHPDKFEWILTKHDQVSSLITNSLLIKGGYDKGYSTYIGRAVAGGETTIGKVACKAGSDCGGLYTVIDGKSKLNKNAAFEMLTYNS